MSESRPTPSFPPPLLRRPVLFWMGALALFMLNRVVLLWFFGERLGGFPPPAPFWLLALRADLMLLSYLTGPFLLLELLLPVRLPLIHHLFRLIWSLLGAFIIFMEGATLPFLQEYDLRPNRIFYEYLAYPREVLGTILGHAPVAFLLVILASMAGALLLWKLGKPLPAEAQTPPAPVRRRLVVFMLLLPLLFLGARNSLGPRPANPSSFAYSPNHLLNELVLNSPLTLFSALYREREDQDPSRLYGSCPWPDVQATLGLPRRSPAGQGSATPRPRHIVVFIMESLGARFVGTLGGQNLTPELDRLSRNGWFWTGLYATGTRSIRGMEAILCGFPPMPGQGVIRRNLAQHDFFTLAAHLAQRGYRTRFCTGGDSSFDGMKGFFLGNGFQEIYDQSSWKDLEPRGVWGIHDDPLFQAVHRLLLADNTPTFTVIFSTSNHSPFDFPKQDLPQPSQPLASVENAIRYSDKALGHFFTEALKAPYGQNSLFLIVADHDTRVFGNEWIPLDRFHIPALFLGQGVPTANLPRRTSQIDLAPTLLALAGCQGPHPMPGRNMLDPGQAALPERAMMLYGDQYGYWEDSTLVILKPHLAPKLFQVDTQPWIPCATQHSPLALKALAHLLWPWEMYHRRLYHPPVATVQTPGLPVQ